MTKHSSINNSSKKKAVELAKLNLFKSVSTATCSISSLLFSWGFPVIKRIHFPLGLWGELSGHYITFICPSETIRGIDDPTPIMQYWDDAIKHIYHLRGRSLENSRRQVIVFDEQPAAGTFF